MVHFKERIARKLRRMILLCLGLVTFKFHLRKIENRVYLGILKLSNLGTLELWNFETLHSTQYLIPNTYNI